MDQVSLALFRDTTADAIAAVSVQMGGMVEGQVQLSLQHAVAAASTSATTFKLRVGPGGPATVYVNGSSAGRKFGGVSNTFIRVVEVLP